MPGPRGGAPWRRFGPWWGVVLMLLGVAIGTAAGLWQLDRASEKRDLEARFSAGNTAEALGRLVADGDAGPLRYRLIRISGHFDGRHQVLLDNISSGGQPGYQVLTPFTTTEGTVLVNRGWLPASGDRDILPDINVGGETREVVGRLEWLPRPAIELATAAPPDDAPWPRRLLFPSVGQVSAQLGTPLRNYQLLLDPEAPDGYLRHWQPGGMGPDRHTAYAVQWFGLALTVVVIYVVLVIRNARQSP